jgi:hypothetical protein
MEDKTTPFEVLLERVQAYAKTSIQLFKLKATEKLAAILSNLASGLVLLIFLILFFVNLNIAIALLIGDLLGKVWLGFVVVSGLCACVGFILYIFSDKWIKRPVSNSIITQLLKDDSLDDPRLPE